MRAHRDRARRGRRMITIEISNELGFALSQAGFLAESDEDDFAKVAAALEKACDAMCRLAEYDNDSLAAALRNARED
jgi:hypothetical protein